MSSSIKWDLHNGYLYAVVGKSGTLVAHVFSSPATSTFWMCTSSRSPNVDLQTQDYAEARQITETILRLEGVI